MRTKEIIDKLTKLRDRLSDEEEIKAIDYAIKRMVELEGLKWKTLLR